MSITQNIAKKIFFITVFLLPLIFYPKTSEIFEFNKIIFLYLSVTLLFYFWTKSMVIQRKFLFRYTTLDLPLIIFLFALSISSIFSIDTHTSIFGYYSRFNGGLLSYISFVFLYWFAVSYLSKEDVLKTLKFLLATTAITSAIAILEHFDISITCFIISLINQEQINISNSCWANDVQNRVYSTFGQPNWLAAWLTAVIPINLFFFVESKGKKQKGIYLALCFLFISALLFTKSRSGILAFVITSLIFWLYYLFVKRSQNSAKEKLKEFRIYAIFVSIVLFVIGTPWSPNLGRILQTKDKINQEETKDFIPALERGGTESGEIRKIVWKGAYEIWKAYPIFGSGLETFAFSYYKYRPIEHNYTTEWEYLYNKAHNEYLNFLATTGAVGALSYIFLIVLMLIIILDLKNLKNLREIRMLNLSLLCGFASILITNFFGFSVVTTNFLFFLFPAFAYATNQNASTNDNNFKQLKKISNSQKTILIIIGFFTIFLFYKIINLWIADYYYQKARNANNNQDYASALKHIEKSISIAPNESIYWNEAAYINSLIATVLSNETDSKEVARQFIENAIKTSTKAINLSPGNVNHLRTQALMYAKLSKFDPKYLLDARNSLIKAFSMSPTDPKIAYNLALAYLRTNEIDQALSYIKKSIDLKEDFKDARYAHALILIDLGDYKIAKSELEYILKYIDPNNKEVQKELEILETLQN